jgi:transposase
VLDATFSRPDLDAFCRLDTLGLTVVGQHLDAGEAVLVCQVREPVEADRWCRACGCAGRPRDTVVRRLAHVPFGWRPTVLLVRLRRYACTGCGRVWRQDLERAAASRGKLSRDAVLWALKSLVIDRLSVARIAAALAVAWHTVNDAVLAAGRQLLIADPHRLDGVEVIGVDEHCWRHPRGQGSGEVERFVTVIIDLTPVRNGTGPARLLDLVEGRSKAVFTGWLQAQTPAFRAGLQVVAMDGFTGFKTATSEALPDAVAVMDPFHVVALAGDALERCRQRVQQQTLGHRGRKGDPLYALRRRLRTGADLLPQTKLDRIDAVLGQEQHLAVAVTWSVYQRIIAAYRQPDRARGKAALAAVIDSLRRGVPAGLPELVTLGRTLSRRAADVLAYFDRPGTSNGPTEAINGRLEHLRGTALGFRNLTHYTTRALLDCGGFRPALHRLLR